MVELKKELAELLPPLSSTEFAALKTDIKQRGITDPICVDEDGNILDGRHRYKINKDAPRKVIRGLTEAEKKAFVFRCNFVRRNLSPDQKRDAHRRMKQVAKELREEDPKKWTQSAVAAALGVDHNTVSRWQLAGRTDSRTRKGSKPDLPDARVKIPKTEKPKLAARVAAGETQAQVAADYGVSQRAVSRICTTEEKKAEEEKERRKRIKNGALPEGCRLIHGDFRKQNIEADSVGAIVTDPPYDLKAVETLYEDFSAFAANVLRPGGSALVMIGQSHLQQALPRLTRHLTYHWLIAYLTPGGQAVQLWPKEVNTFWKPVVWLIKGQYAGDWQGDVVKSAINDNDKRFHEWGQSESGIGALVEKFTITGELVLDPFCGAGTTGVACMAKGRQFLGIDADKTAIKTAKSRLLQ